MLEKHERFVQILKDGRVQPEDDLRGKYQHQIWREFSKLVDKPDSVCYFTIHADWKKTEVHKRRGKRRKAARSHLYPNQCQSPAAKAMQWNLDDDMTYRHFDHRHKPQWLQSNLPAQSYHNPWWLSNLRRQRYHQLQHQYYGSTVNTTERSLDSSF